MKMFQELMQTTTQWMVEDKTTEENSELSNGCHITLNIFRYFKVFHRTSQSERIRWYNTF